MNLLVFWCWDIVRECRAVLVAPQPHLVYSPSHRQFRCQMPSHRTLVTFSDTFWDLRSLAYGSRSR